jgi:hypothetical protein
LLTAGDLCDAVAALAPMPLRFEGLVDGLNRRLELKVVESTYAIARKAYAGSTGNLAIGEPSDQVAVARWLTRVLN